MMTGRPLCYAAGQLYPVPETALPEPDWTLSWQGESLSGYRQLPPALQSVPPLSLRSADYLGRSDWPRYAALLSLANWHQSQGFCPQCAAPTQVFEQVHRYCSDCALPFYARTDPAILARVSHQDRLLLVNKQGTPPDRFSLIAGFINAGETAEACVAREVLEEAGVSVSVGTYLGSQPWPFSGCLMFGFDAEALSERLVPDGVEIAQARWFERDGLAQAVQRGQIQLPTPGSLSRQLIDDWLAAD